MPRGFLVKRNRDFAAVSHRPRRLDYEAEPWDRLPADTGRGLAVQPAHLAGAKPYDSPDSGYGSGPPTPATPDLRGQTFTAQIYKNFVPSPSNVLSPVGCRTWTASSSRDMSHQTGSSDRLFQPILKIPTTPVTASTPTKCSTTRKRRCREPSADRSGGGVANTAKKPKAARKINFDRDDRSPVLGTFIRAAAAGEVQGKDGEIKGTTGWSPDGGQPRGLFVCKLCQGDYHDPLSLAQHQCSRIENVVYQCPECDKIFNCHANLASHRRWHKPRPVYLPTDSPSFLPASPDSKAAADSGPGSAGSSPRSTPSPTGDSASPHRCEHCGKTYRRPANLRRHLRRHGESETHPCFSCGQTFNSLTERAKHVLLQACQDKEDNS